MRNSSRTSVAVAAVVLTIALGAMSTWHVEAADVVGSPVAFELCSPEGAAAVEKCQIIGNPPSYTVPPGRVLTIEQVSGDCGGDGQIPSPWRVSIIAQTGGVSVPHWIIGVADPDSVAGPVPLTNTRIYADGNSSLTVGLTEVPGFNNRFCRLSFSGTLTKP
jgi:hypothetical protein